MAFRNRDGSGAQAAADAAEGRKVLTPADFAPPDRNTGSLAPARIAPDDEDALDREAQIVESVARASGFHSTVAPVRPKLRRRLVEEAQDTFTTQVRRSTLDTFDEWCATHGYTKKAGFEEMVRRVTRRQSSPQR